MAKRKRRRRRKTATKRSRIVHFLVRHPFVIIGVLSVLVYGIYLVYGMQYDAWKNTREVLDPNDGIREHVEAFFTKHDAHEMIPIIQCETHFRHFAPDGSILTNAEGSTATGVAQILDSVHPDPKVLEVYNKRFEATTTIDDFDLTTIDGNLEYALILYEVRGTRDWECAKQFKFAS